MLRRTSICGRGCSTCCTRKSGTGAGTGGGASITSTGRSWRCAVSARRTRRGRERRCGWRRSGSRASRMRMAVGGRAARVIWRMNSWRGRARRRRRRGGDSGCWRGGVGGGGGLGGGGGCCWGSRGRGGGGGGGRGRGRGGPKGSIFGARGSVPAGYAGAGWGVGGVAGYGDGVPECVLSAVRAVSELFSVDGFDGCGGLERRVLTRRHRHRERLGEGFLHGPRWSATGA